jgi:hypothetical protein
MLFELQHSTQQQISSEGSNTCVAGWTPFAAAIFGLNVCAKAQCQHYSALLLLLLLHVPLCELQLRILHPTIADPLPRA